MQNPREYIKHNSLPYHISFGPTYDSIFILHTSNCSPLFLHREELSYPHGSPPPQHLFEIHDLCSAPSAPAQGQRRDERRPGMYAKRDIILDGQPILVEHPALIAPYLLSIDTPKHQEEVYKAIWSRLQLSSPASLKLKHSLTRIAQEWRGRGKGREDGVWSGYDKNEDWNVLREVLIRGFVIKLDVPKEGPHDKLKLHSAVFLQAGRCRQSSKPNARCEWDSKTFSLSLYPLKPIRNGEEITITYQSISCANPSSTLHRREHREAKQRACRVGDMCKCLDCALDFVNVPPSKAAVSPTPPRNLYAAPLPSSPALAPSSGYVKQSAKAPHPSPYSGHRYLIYATGGTEACVHAESTEDIAITVFDDNDANGYGYLSFSPSSPRTYTSSLDDAGNSDDLLTPNIALLDPDRDKYRNVSIHFPVSALTAAAAAVGLPTFKEWLRDPDIRDQDLIEFHLRALKKIEYEELHELDRSAIFERENEKMRLRHQDSICDVSTSTSSSSRRSRSSSNSSNSSGGSASTSNTTVVSEASSTSLTTAMSANCPVMMMHGVNRAKTRAEARQVHTEAIAMCFGALGDVGMFRYWATLVADGKLKRAGERRTRHTVEAEVEAEELEKVKVASVPLAGSVDLDDVRFVRGWIDAPETFPLWRKKRRIDKRNI